MMVSAIEIIKNRARKMEDAILILGKLDNYLGEK